MSIPKNPYEDKKGFWLSDSVWDACSKEWAKWILGNSSKEIMADGSCYIRMPLSKASYEAILNLAGEKE